MSIIGKTANVSGDRSRLEKLLSHHAVDITPRTEWGDRSVIFRPDNYHHLGTMSPQTGGLIHIVRV